MKIQYWQILALALVAGVLTGWVIIRLLRYLSSRNDRQVFRTIYSSITHVLYFFFPALFLTLVANNRFIRARESVLVYSLSKVLLIAISTWLTIRIITIFERLILNQLDLNKTNNLQERKLFTKVKFIKRLVVIAVLIVSVSLLLLSFRQGREFGLGILTSAGIVSVIVGFAAQKTIANLLAGIQIAFTQPIKIEDVVIVENEWGRIEEINLTYVVVKLWDLRRMILPITYFVENSYQNWTRNDSSIIGSALFSLDFHAPVDKLRSAFKTILDESSLWDGETAALQVTDTRDQYMVVRTIMSAHNASDAFDLRCEVREKLIEYIRKEAPEALPKYPLENIKSGLADARPL
ncbi:mechanosensitive ion channel family protein [Salmonirosea aquatica]|uniref:Mechanosensitive ion channel n=1 Tax=Salmonirosea aquatica TaxID=2654236 RepID=A0A7C9BDS2_9BACT|nr:mechanosensitive ion channel [Cytophagaceae bacterium SJW1-29]